MVETDPRAVIARREVRSLVSEKTIVLALVIQLFIAGFSSFLVVGLVSLYSPGDGPSASVDAAVAGDDVGNLQAALAQTPGVDVRRYDSPDDARLDFQTSAVDTALLVEAADRGRVRVTVLAPDSNIKTTVVVTQVRRALRSYEATERAERADSLERVTLTAPPDAGGNTYFGFTYTVLVPLLLFLPVFLAGSITVDSLTEELDRGTMELLRVAPVTATEIVEGKLLSVAAITPAQALAWMFLLRLNGTTVRNVPSLLGVVVGATLLVVVGSAVLATAVPDRRIAQTLYSLGALGLFGLAGLTPLSPPNAVARLAVGSPSSTAYVSVGLTVVVGFVCLAVVRRTVDWERLLVR